jgi:hypothetical protein
MLSFQDKDVFCIVRDFWVIPGGDQVISRSVEPKAIPPENVFQQFLRIPEGFQKRMCEQRVRPG